jgi:hypothetical protein
MVLVSSACNVYVQAVSASTALSKWKTTLHEQTKEEVLKVRRKQERALIQIGSNEEMLERM